MSSQQSYLANLPVCLWTRAILVVNAVPLRLPAEDYFDGELSSFGRISVDDVGGAFL